MTILDSKSDDAFSSPQKKFEPPSLGRKGKGLKLDMNMLDSEEIESPEKSKDIGFSKPMNNL